MGEPVLPMKFWDICKGNFAQDIQAEFEEAQIKALNTGKAVKVNINISITPPVDEDDNCGSINYDYKSTNPKMECRRPYTTKFNGNTIVADDTDLASLMQYKMNFGEGESENGK